MNWTLPTVRRYRRSTTEDERKKREPTAGTNQWFIAGMARAG